jgi:hypothetical protein
VAGRCEQGNEPSGSVKDGKFLDWLSDYYLLKKYSVSWSWVGLGWLVAWFHELCICKYVSLA